MKAIVPNAEKTIIKNKIVFTVNTSLLETNKEARVFNSLASALEEASKLKMCFSNGEEIVCEIQIKKDLIIKERIMIVGADLSHVVITSEDNAVIYVDASDWVNSDGTYEYQKNCIYAQNTVPFIAGENRAQMPTIGCVFSLIEKPRYCNIRKQEKQQQYCLTSGYFASRGSSGLILPNCGFIGFSDNIFSTQDSSIVAHSAIAKNAERYGIHARHNGEIAARGINVSGSLIGAYADKIADIDMREAIVVEFDNYGAVKEPCSKVAVWAKNLSRINAGSINFSGIAGINVEVDKSEQTIKNAVNVFDVDIDDKDYAITKSVEVGVIHSEIGSTINVYKGTYDKFDENINEDFIYNSKRYIIKSGSTIVASNSYGKDLSEEYNYNNITNNGIIYY